MTSAFHCNYLHFDVFLSGKNSEKIYSTNKNTCFLGKYANIQNRFLCIFAPNILLMTIQDTIVTVCEYDNKAHLQAIASLLNGYNEDEMGRGVSLTESEQQQLVDGLKNHPTAIVLLAENSGVYCGLLVGFEIFSTFTVRPIINIHDVFVSKTYRGKGIGRRLIQAIVDEAKKKNCSRISLEVRHDNATAQNLYKSIGFVETDPPMYYWCKYIYEQVI